MEGWCGAMHRNICKPAYVGPRPICICLRLSIHDAGFTCIMFARLRENAEWSFSSTCWRIREDWWSWRMEVRHANHHLLDLRKGSNRLGGDTTSCTRWCFETVIRHNISTSPIFIGWSVCCFVEKTEKHWSRVPNSEKSWAITRYWFQ